MKKILSVARIYAQHLKTAIDSPMEHNVTPIIKSVVESLMKKNPNLFEGVDKVAEHVRVERGMDANCFVYFIIDLVPEKYLKIHQDPVKKQRDDLIVSHLKPTLEQTFKGYVFNIKIGYVSA